MEIIIEIGGAEVDLFTASRARTYFGVVMNNLNN